MLGPQLSYMEPALPAIADLGSRVPPLSSCPSRLLPSRQGTHRAFIFSPRVFGPPSDPTTSTTQVSHGLNRAQHPRWSNLAGFSPSGAQSFPESYTARSHHPAEKVFGGEEEGLDRNLRRAGLVRGKQL
jgi:hypothetical protein